MDESEKSLFRDADDQDQKIYLVWRCVKVSTASPSYRRFESRTTEAETQKEIWVVTVE